MCVTLEVCINASRDGGRRGDGGKRGGPRGRWREVAGRLWRRMEWEGERADRKLWRQGCGIGGWKEVRVGEMGSCWDKQARKIGIETNFDIDIENYRSSDADFHHSTFNARVISLQYMKSSVDSSPVSVANQKYQQLSAQNVPFFANSDRQLQATPCLIFSSLKGKNEGNALQC
ncbi:hypothetical protein DL95DRAFT_400793 [Leptodontidium sp. 2 PMI_412]|nr:hypothetical protein DL95DRAFT_400793 [Leptodontidium sp. 2 PMI_412]